MELQHSGEEYVLRHRMQTALQGAWYVFSVVSEVGVRMIVLGIPNRQTFFD